MIFDFSVKHFYVMGGSMEGVGNVTTTAEFNFYVDPEAGNQFYNLSELAWLELKIIWC